MSEDKEMTLYEVSIHLIPSLSEDDAKSHFEKLVAKIEKEGGSVKTSQPPQSRELAYEMSKELAGKKNYYNESYFAFAIFEGETSFANDLNKELGEDKSVLRHLLIKVPKEVLITRERKIPTSHKEEVKKTEDDKKAEGPIDEAEIDKTIDELVVE